MIDYEKMRTAVPKGLTEYLKVPVIRGNQTGKRPTGSFMIYNPTTIASANNGTWQQHADGIDRLMVRSIWSFTSISDDYDASISNAIRAREWFLHTGRIWLSEQGIIVQSCTDITNRDNILTVEYERKNGFDVVFYVYDEAKNLAATTGYIESAEIAHEIKK